MVKPLAAGGLRGRFRHLPCLASGQMASALPAKAFRAAPYAYAEARAIADALDLSEPVAITLVRRGYRTVAAAREFIEGDESHDPLALAGVGAAVERLLAAVRDGDRITVHGDYDVDGVSATAILVARLRGLGADCDWLIPDRLTEGYGLSDATVGRLAARETRLLLTADCGITCADEIARAREAGIEAIVSDHHALPERLPDCTVVHPGLGGYPFAELCGTGVAYKLSAALLAGAGEDPAAAAADLDAVALATVADLVPLRGENRALVRRGLAELRRARRPGLRALMAVSATDPTAIGEAEIAFRLAPRINAAGRLYRADAAVELLLTEDEGRAAEIAAELDSANHERRAAEREVACAAESAMAALPEAARAAPAMVLAGEGWHAGVVGIVASRMLERLWRPVVLIGLDGDAGRGSGRSIPAYDLVDGLRACAGHLGRFGGHAAAAGLEIEAAAVDGFRQALAAHAADRLRPQDMVRTESVDAVIGGDSLGLDLAEELERLAPFGIGNPGVRLLVPSAKIADVRPMGEGRHARFSLRSGGHRAGGVAFGAGATLPAAPDEALDVAVRLELNQWNGAVEPRVVLREMYPHPAPADAEVGCKDCLARARDGEWWSRLEAELAIPLDDWPPAALMAAAERGGERNRIERRPGSAVATIAELLSSGADVLALCCDTSRRRLLAERVADPGRFGGGHSTLACGRCADRRVEAIAPAPGGLALADWHALARHPGLAGPFGHVVVVDPPPFAHLEALARRREGPAGAGYLHRCSGPTERELALRVHAVDWDPRAGLAEIYRALRAAGGESEGEELATILAGDGRHPRTPEQAGRCVRVLDELGIARWTASDGSGALGVVSSERTELGRSPAYRAYRGRHEEGSRFLSARQARE